VPGGRLSIRLAPLGGKVNYSLPRVIPKPVPLGLDI